MERLKYLPILALLLFGCARSPEFWQTYSSTVTAAASVGMGGYGTPTPIVTPDPALALVNAGFNVTAAAVSVQSAQTSLDQTRTSYEYAAALASLEAQQVIATQYAPVTSAAATVASANVTATANALATRDSITATLQAIEVAAIGGQATADSIISIASAQGTATAIARVAQIEEDARLAGQDALATANKKAEGKAFLSWFVPSVLMAVLLLLGSSMAYRITVQARPQAMDADRDWMVFDHAGQPMIAAPRRHALPAVIDSTAKPASTAVTFPLESGTELPDIAPGVLQVGVFDGGRPVQLGPGFMGIQVTGEKGSGKSSLLRLLAAQALVHGWDVFYADAEALTFDPQLWGPVAQSTADARLLFAWLRQDIFDNRHQMFRDAFQLVESNLPPEQRFLVDNLGAYNKAAALFNLARLKPMLLVWDEANSHLKDKPLQALVEKAFQASRKVGCDTVVAGHDWRADHVPAGVKLQLHNSITMRCGSQDSQLILKDPQLASVIPPNRPGLAYVRIRQHTGYMQSYFIPDPRLISMVRGARPRLTSAAPWTLHINREEPEALMGVEELFQLAEGEQEATRPRQLDPTNPLLRQRVLELWRSTKPDGTPYSQRDIEGIVTGEFCQDSYKGGQAFKIVKEIINGAVIPA